MDFSQFFFLVVIIFSCVSCNKSNWGFSLKYPLATKPEEECGFTQNLMGQRISWKSNYPVIAMLSDESNDDVYNATVAAALKWNESVGQTIIRVRRSTDPNQEEQAGHPIIKIKMKSDWEEKKFYEQGVTTISYKGNLINSAKIKVNSKNYNFFFDESEAGAKLHLESLLIHEFGHLMGLKHY